MELFPELFQSNQLTDGTGQSLAITEEKSAPDWAVRKEEEEVVKEVAVVKEVTVVKGPDLSQTLASSPSDLTAEKLNYEAIQEELAGHSVRAKILLMQALRWVTWVISLTSVLSIFIFSI